MQILIKHFFWGDSQTSVLRQKSLGSSIMVSDFIDEVSGYLRNDVESARVMLETRTNGYFNNDLLLKQVEKAIDKTMKAKRNRGMKNASHGSNQDAT